MTYFAQTCIAICTKLLKHSYFQRSLSPFQLSVTWRLADFSFPFPTFLAYWRNAGALDGLGLFALGHVRSEITKKTFVKGKICS